MARLFVAPPNWPQPEPGWIPPDGWRAPAAWGPPPAGWQFWQDLPEHVAPAPLAPPSASNALVASAAAPAGNTTQARIPLFGARSRVRELSAEIATLREHMDRIGASDVLRLEEQRAALAATLEQESAALDRQLEEHKAKLHADGQAAAIQLERTLSGLSKEVAALEGRRHDLEASIEAQQRKHTAKLEQDLQASRAKIDAEHRAATRKLETTLTRLRADIDGLEARKRELQATLVADEETAMLQEVGVYQTRHPLTDATAYQQRLAGLRLDIKQMNKKDGGAVDTPTSVLTRV